MNFTFEALKDDLLSASDMHVKLREREAYSILWQFVIYPLIDGIKQIPIVFCLGPAADLNFDTAVKKCR